jgi:CubicO group peptidase (beta-lactamase class C family)
MRLVDRGALALDVTVSSLLGPSWSRDSLASQVTVRQLLSHTAGLANFLGDRTRYLLFPPGARYEYSGVGFMVLQEIIEQQTAGPLDAAMSQLVFQPLGMGHSWFARRARSAATAYGHVVLWRAALPFVIIFVPLFGLGLAAVVLGDRVRRGAWRLTRMQLALTAFVALGLTAMFLASRASVVAAAFPFSAIGFGTLALIAGAGALVWRALAARRRITRAVTSAVVVALLAALGGRQAIPMPPLAPAAGNAAASVHTSALDLGQFLIELSQPALLSDSAAKAFGREAVAVGRGVAWGLGIGIQIDASGRAFFHWGSNPAARGFLLCYPEAGAGIAVLANADLSRGGIVRIVEAALGGETTWAAY